MASAPQSSTRGFPEIPDAELVRTVLDRSLATQSEVDHCKALKERPAQKAENKSLIQIMVEARALTPNQARRILQEAADSNKVREPPGYQIIEPIGKGSMGMVYRAKQLSMDRTVALKMLLKQLALNKDFIERFHREARIAAKLSHGNIVQAIDSGEFGGQHYFVMEFVDGTNIKLELDKGKVYSEKEAVNVILQVAEAMDHAHQKGLIHRDIKPENIMLTGDGVAKLADLGLARLTADDALAQAEKGVAMGTPYYISPEQIRGAVDIDIRTDIYSLGATLYHMVTGRVPFPGKTPSEVMQKHLRDKLVPPDHINTELSGGLGLVVETMMAKDRGVRYPSPQDLIVDLKNLFQGKAPIIAGQSFDASAMAKLAQSEGADDDLFGDEARDFVPEGDTPRAELDENLEHLASQLNLYRVLSTVFAVLLGCAALIIIILLLQPR